MSIRILNQDEYEVKNYGVSLFIEINKLTMPPVWDDLLINIMVQNADGTGYKHLVEHATVNQGVVNKKIIMYGQFDPDPKITITVQWQTDVLPLRAVPLQQDPVAELTKFEQTLAERIKILKEQRKEAEGSFLYWIGLDWDRVLDLTLKIQMLEGSLEDTKKLLTELRKSWEFGVSIMVTEASPVGIYYRVVEGVAISVGEKMSPQERALEAVLIGAIIFKLHSGTRPYTRIRPPIRKEVPEFLQDIADTLKKRRKALKAADRTYDKYEVIDLKRASKKLDRYKTTGERAFQSFVSAEKKGDRVILYRLTVPGDSLQNLDFSKACKIELPWSRYGRFIEEALEPSPVKPGWYFGGCHHAHTWP